jgi:hypothetical protein
MDKGAKAVAAILLAALAIGLLVVILHPDFREAARCLWRGRPHESPIWQSNERYYPGLTLPGAPSPHAPE